MKKIFFLITSVFIMASCDDNKKITPYLKEKKEIRMGILNGSFITNIGFLFIIDISGSMAPFRESLADSLNLFLTPILKKYPYYNYHFAFTTMTPSNKFNLDKKPLYFQNFLDECGYSQNMRFKNSNIGNYLQYSYSLSKEIDIEKLICVLNLNTKMIKGFDGGTESYFQSLGYILDKSSSNFKKDFLGEDKILTLFFISDNWTGVDYTEMLSKQTQYSKYKIAEDLADKYINKFKSFFDIQKSLRSYAAVQLYERSDSCTSGEGTGDTPDNYPFHAYKFIEKTNGLKLSICDEDLGKKLSQVSENFLSSFKQSEFFLDEFPEAESIELYFNEIEVPYDLEEGWFFDMENLAIQFGSKFNWSYYSALSSKELSESELRVLYHPLNLEILKEGSEK